VNNPNGASETNAGTATFWLTSIFARSASGVLSGTPTASGDYTFMVKATDSVGNFGTQNLTLHVATPGGLVYAANCTGTCGSGVGTGNVSAYIIDAATGALIPVSAHPLQREFPRSG